MSNGKFTSTRAGASYINWKLATRDIHSICIEVLTERLRFERRRHHNQLKVAVALPLHIFQNRKQCIGVYRSLVRL